MTSLKLLVKANDEPPTAHPTSNTRPFVQSNDATILAVLTGKFKASLGPPNSPSYGNKSLEDPKWNNKYSLTALDDSYTMITWPHLIDWLIDKNGVELCMGLMGGCMDKWIDEIKNIRVEERSNHEREKKNW